MGDDVRSKAADRVVTLVAFLQSNGFQLLCGGTWR